MEDLIKNFKDLESMTGRIKNNLIISIRMRKTMGSCDNRIIKMISFRAKNQMLMIMKMGIDRKKTKMFLQI